LLVSDEIERGTLVQPFGPTLDGYRYWLVYPEGRADSQATGALRKWIRLEMAGRSAASG
jgi:LysR family glycine cleavage system transcriptional activator